jgi:hypothetical protein
VKKQKSKNDLPVQGASAFQLSTFSASRHNLSLLERKTAAFLTSYQTIHHLSFEFRELSHEEEIMV